MKWDDYHFGIANVVAAKSKDRSTKVGCVIVGPDQEIRSTGYNSFPRGLNDDVEARHERPEKYLWTEHAERNAIYNAARVGIPLKGCKIFTSLMPCMDCARAIVQAGICEVVTPFFGKSDWQEQQTKAATMFGETGVAVRYV